MRITNHLQIGMTRMRYFPTLLLLAGLLACSLPAQAQTELTVSGVVSDEQVGEPLPGANVRLKSDPSVGTATNIDGEYSLTVPSPSDTLIVSFIGYATAEVPVMGRSTIDVALGAAALEGDEVVVVGYTAERSRNITGAVATLQPEELTDRQLGTIEQAMKGRIPGVRVESTGEPGVGASITIRGSAFIGNNQPLYVVDGVYTGQNPNLNPDDIASIRVLKDASAAAQYGAQAANGVVLISTKKGSAGDVPNVSFRSYVGYQDVSNPVDMADAQEWASIMQMAYDNAGQEAPRSVTNPEDYADTNWQDEILQSGMIQNYSLSLSGGSASASYLVSGNYFDQEGTVIDSPFERYTARVNSEIRRGIFTLGETATFIRSTKNNISGAPLVLSVQHIPTVPVYDESRVGGFGVGSNPDNEILVSNPVGDQLLSNNNNYYNRLLGSVYGEVQLLDFLSYRLNVGLEYTDLTNESFRYRGTTRMNDPLEPAWYRETVETNASVQIENLLNFDGSFGDHTVTAVAGYREERVDFEYLTAYREGFFDESLQQLRAGSENPEADGYETTITRRSLISRANYSFKDRYLLTGTFRRDGASNFGPDNRWGNFYSGSIGWVLSDESFYEAVPVLGRHVNFLKLRASYGELGNADIDPYGPYARIAQNLGYTLGPDARLAPGAIQLALANPEIRWQENQQTNIGADLRLFDDALNVEANYYVSTSDQLLLQAPLPGSLGATGTPFVNAGSIENRGFELGLGYGLERRDWDLNVSANLTLPDNEVLSLGNDNQPIFSGPFGVSRTAVGGTVGALYVLETDGLFQQGDAICLDASGATCVEQNLAFHTSQTAPGDVRFVDQNGDGLINDEDRVNAGSAVPDFEGGFRVAGRYKAVDFSVALRGTYGNELFNVPLYWNAPGTGAGIRSGVEPWTPENTDTDTPRVLREGVAAGFNNQAISDRWIEDGSFLRVQNIEVGYQVPVDRLGTMIGAPDASLRVYLSVENAFTLTGYSNWDPATPGQGTLAPAVDDLAIYPSGRTFTFGVDLGL